MRAAITAGIGILLLCGLFAGCGGGAGKAVYHDPSFTVSSLDEGLLVVLGAVSLADEDTNDLRESRTREFEELAREQLSCLSPMSRGEAWILADVDATRALLDDYRNTGRLTAEHFQTLSPLATRARYALLARFDLDRVTYDYRREQRDEGDRVVINLEPESRREMGALFDVFDLQLGRLVWSMTAQRVDIERGRLHEVESLDSIPTQAEFYEAVREVTAGDRRADDPDPVRARKELFRKALRSLPVSK